MTDTRLAVIGSWHQASVNGACLAELGHSVVGVVEPVLLEQFRAGRGPVHEPGLNELAAAQLAAGRLSYTADVAEGLAGAEFALVAIDTPVDDDDRSDLAPIERAFDAIAAGASGPLVVCLSAQVPVGTTEELAGRLRAARPDLDLPVVYVPEFLRLGTALESFREADRFVVGADDRHLAERVAALYRDLGRPILLTDIRSAEMGKHASNVFLATSISFINEIADLCQVTGADVTEVARIMRLDGRIGPRAFLAAGVGYAGGTLGREIRTLQGFGRAHDVPTDLLDAVDLVNSRRLASLERQLDRLLDGDATPRVAVLGLTYKAGTSTLRRSAALTLIGRLNSRGFRITGFDPLARPGELADLPEFELAPDPYAAAAGADAVVLLSPWPGFADTDLARLAAAMRRPRLLDAGNHLDPVAARAAGFEYEGVGR